MNDSKEDKADETHARWQDIALTQLGYSINLILAFSLASIGFGVSLWDGEPKPQFCLYMVALFLLCFSIIFGIGCTITRLCDFRKTREIAKLKLDNCCSSEIERLQECTTELGKWTWRIFWLQLSLFILGFICLAASIAIPIIFASAG